MFYYEFFFLYECSFKCGQYYVNFWFYAAIIFTLFVRCIFWKGVSFDLSAFFLIFPFSIIEFDYAKVNTFQQDWPKPKTITLKVVKYQSSFFFDMWFVLLVGSFGKLKYFFKVMINIFSWQFGDWNFFKHCKKN